jgi:two-component SAPR family response regulator
MEGLNGLDLGIEIKKLYPDIKILYTSGYISHIDSRLFGKNFLIKPFTLKELTDRIEEMIKD